MMEQKKVGSLFVLLLAFLQTVLSKKAVIFYSINSLSILIIMITIAASIIMIAIMVIIKIIIILIIINKH